MSGIEVTPILDAEGTFATVDRAFSNLKPEVREQVESDWPEYFRGERWWLPVNAALIRSPDASILVDTGIGPPPREFVPDADSHLLGELERLGVTRESIDLVIQTHLHIDHVGCTGMFPNARYVVHKGDLDYFLGPESLEERPHLLKLVPIREAVQIDAVEGESEPVPGVRILPTPGHTPGHVSVRVEGADGPIVILGDVVLHASQVLAPETGYISDHDHDAAVRTRKEFLGTLADEGVAVIAAHLYGIGRFVRRGDGFDWRLC
jgi:glyoxylase-like metal-dependent hydrolase (beta-lactamase superfamily II)